jgi:hypothetical protein
MRRNTPDMLTMRLFHIVCAVVALLTAALPHARAQAVSVENVRASMNEGGLVEISYDLLGPSDVEYNVSVALLVRSQASPQRRKLEDVTGDVGIVPGPGKGRRIVWDMSGEFPSPLPGAEYEFEVSASIRRGGGISWYLYAGAAVLVGGIAYLAIKPPAKEEEQQTVMKSIPIPPER